MQHKLLKGRIEISASIYNYPQTNMNSNVYVLKWYGPFHNSQEVIEWENKEIGNGKTYLYIFKGKKSYKHKFSYYCGQAFKQSSGKRMTNKRHHINDVKSRPSELKIWVAKFANLNRPRKVDVNIAEKLITSVISQVIITDESAVLNQTNKLRPRKHIYLINEWYYKNGYPMKQYREGAICKMLPDVLICYPDSDEKRDYIWGSRCIRYINELK